MKTNSSSIIKTLLILFLVFAGLHYAKDFLVPLSIGALLATLFLPFCKWLEKHKIPRGLSVLSCLLILLLAISAVAALLGWQIAELTNDLPLIKQKTVETANRIQEYIFNQFGISSVEQWQLLKEQQNSVTDIIQLMAGSLIHIFTGFILMLVYVFLLLYYRIHIKHFILKLSSDSHREEMEHVISRVTHVSQQYLLGLTKMIVCLWIMYGIGFSLVGAKNPFFFAILCGLLEIIPYIGNITGTTVTVLVSAIHGAGLPVLATIILTYGLVQLIQGWILEPLILGPQVKINPLFTIIVLVLGQIVWGIPGIILAIPLTGMLKIVCDHIESLKPYGFLIGEIENKKKESGLIKRMKGWFK